MEIADILGTDFKHFCSPPLGIYSQKYLKIIFDGFPKMICAYLGLLVLQKVFKIENGVGLGTMPISALMEEKLKTSLVRTGLITMNGDLKSSIHETDAFLSDPIEQFKNGDINLVLGHPESWLTSTAEQITACLSSDGIIVGTFLDEFQMNLAEHWGSDFRFALFQ